MSSAQHSPHIKVAHQSEAHQLMSTFKHKSIVLGPRAPTYRMTLKSSLTTKLKTLVHVKISSDYIFPSLLWGHRRQSGGPREERKNLAPWNRFISWLFLHLFSFLPISHPSQ